jgi:hypothetical protein
MVTEESQPNGRPEGMSDIEWLVALEEIRQLKARRDRYVDAHDWDGYASLHAPDHVSHHAPDPKLGLEPEPWTSVGQMMDNIRRQMPEDFFTAHHSYDPEINFETPTKARGIWAMTTGGAFNHANGEPGWSISYGYYFETYEKRDGRWLFTTRRWQRYIGMGSQEGSEAVEVVFPRERLKGSDAFDDFG